MKIIRWGGLLAFVVITAFIVVLTTLLIDKIIERTIERQASLAVGARVEIGKLDLKIFSLSVSIHDIRITNPDEPMRNIIETGSVAFDLAAVPLLRKKVVIEKLGVKDIALNTERATSGALSDRPKDKKPEIQKIPEQNGQDKCEFPDFSVLSDLEQKAPEEILKGVSLKSSEFLANHLAKVSDARGTWEKKLANLPTKQSIEADVKTLKSMTEKRPQDISKLPVYLDKLNKVRKRLTDAKTLLVAARQDFESEISGLKQSLSSKEIENLKSNDLRSVMAGLDLDIPSSEGLVCAVIGKKITAMVTRGIAWYKKLNDFMPAGIKESKKNKPDIVPRLKGVDVRFPTNKGYPDFLVEEAFFSARLVQKAEVKKLAFSRLSGSIQGITTQPAIYGRPTFIDLSGALSSGAARDVSLKGTLDRRSVTAEDSISLMINEFVVKPEGSTAFEKSPVRLSSAVINVKSDVKVMGENLNGRVYLTVNNPTFDVGQEAAVLKNLFQNTGTFDIDISLSGTLDNISVSLSSSLAGMIRTKLGDIVQEQLGGFENRLRDAMASRIQKQMIDSIRETNSLEDFILGQLSERISLAGTVTEKEAGGDTKQPATLLKKGLPLSF
ncbi:MAG: TIGR03545 family protein [Deltaproteobacteria bacterium]|nr:TIGR03545 family protein [Deltaproteobacteria bacterium]